MRYSGVCIGGPLDRKNCLGFQAEFVGAEMRNTARKEAILASRSETL